jgi:transcriptional regulator with XRE-family HTH domain
MEKINTQWFRDRMADKKISQRRLAMMMNIDPAAASMMFRAKRRMSPYEAHQVSQILGVPLNEVLRHAGIDVTEDVRKVPITSFMDADGAIHLMPSRTHDTVLAPADCPVGTYAVQVRSPASLLDSWLLFISPVHEETDKHVNSLCVTATDDGRHLMAVVRRGYRGNTFNLVLWPSMNVSSDVKVAWTSQVLWIKPQ